MMSRARGRLSRGVEGVECFKDDDAHPIPLAQIIYVGNNNRPFPLLYHRVIAAPLAIRMFWDLLSVKWLAAENSRPG